MWRSVEGAASRSPSSGSLPDGAVGQTSKTVGAGRVASRVQGRRQAVGACVKCPRARAMVSGSRQELITLVDDSGVSRLCVSESRRPVSFG